MLTANTQTAIAVLNDISCGEISPRLAQYALLPHTLSDLLSKLESAGLIRPLMDKNKPAVLSYELIRPAIEISLQDVLEATDEHLNCNHETGEELYSHYGVAARKLGVVNHMTRLCLSEIKIIEL